MGFDDKDFYKVKSIEIIRNVNPYCRTDAIYIVDDLEGYDDRDFIETNLLDTYDRLIDFIGKYTIKHKNIAKNGDLSLRLEE